MDEKERDSEVPFPREPWQRLLAQDAGGPPETTDAHIRAAARRDLTPRGRRWWLPASLAASFVLAVMIVHSEFGSIRRPLTESPDVGGDNAVHGRIVTREKAEEARARGAAPAAAARQAAPAVSEPLDAYGNEAEDEAAEAGGIGPRIGGPEHDLRSSSELPEEAAADRYADNPAPPPTRVELPRMPAPSPRAEPSAAKESADAAAAALARPPTPEAWYAAIVKLRADGKTEEAERELERLKKAYPGWLEQHLSDNP
jgi:hypothetical protein